LRAAGPALFLAAEDEVADVHRRLDAMAAGKGLALVDLAGLHICGLGEQDAVKAAPVRKAAVLAPTPLWHGLLNLVEIQIDRDLRVLSLKKMNYGPRGRRRVIGEGAHD
jgi:hypothetical protein